MKTTSVTVGVLVGDLPAASRWYQTVFELDGPSVEPVEGIVEYLIGGCWLQLAEAPPDPGGWVFRVGVPDVQAEHARLETLGISAGPIHRVDDVIEYFEFTDPDGNRLSFYTVIQP
ncbi:VOC family protein [Streptosporangiaceae bacterium NEAU-GS5]|nr:VOC family protein [Streptosporangiaceae bacterium NEAU-GS5]